MRKIKIYPEWNVNVEIVDKIFMIGEIKIYPEWNVNQNFLL